MSLMILVLLISKLAAISRNWSLVYFRCRRLNLEEAKYAGLFTTYFGSPMNDLDPIKIIMASTRRTDINDYLRIR